MNKLAPNIIFVFVISTWAFPAERSTAQSKDRCPVEVTLAIRQVKQQLCPDNRLDLFDIWGIKQDSTIILHGETTNKAAYDSCLAQVEHTTKLQIVDKIVVLPNHDLGEDTYGIINISTANLRRSPSVGAELINQGLMGSLIRLHKSNDGWYFCQFEDGYLGWMHSWSFVRVDSAKAAAWKQQANLIVTSNFSQVLTEKDDNAVPISDLVCGCVLDNLKRDRHWTEVALPDGRKGFVRSSDVVPSSKLFSNTAVTGDKIAKTAYRFLGYPYLWGGSSSKGFDCSGFTKTVFFLNGIRLPRDANMQAHFGSPVLVDDGFSQLKSGDLLFFGRDAERITHVGIYVGDKKFIHSDGMVRIGSFDPQSKKYDSYRLKNLRRVRRVF